MNLEQGRASWKTRTGFLLAAIGSAVGLGNIWRFPYVAYENGGGAFFIPYVIALFFVGIPLMMAEQAMGQFFRGSFPATCARINRRFEMLGWWAPTFTMFGIMFYYSVILSWCLNYFYFSFDLSWGQDTGAFFIQTFLGRSADAFDINAFRWPIVAGSLFIWIVVWMIVARGIQQGIELANLIFMPLLLILIAIIVIWSLTLPGAHEGILTYVTPDLTRLSDRHVWVDAFSQIFYSLSLGLGVMTAYASYISKKTPISNNAIITCLSNSGVEVFAGFAVFSMVGYIALTSNIPVADAVGEGPGLAFVTYPKAISLLPFGQSIFGILFFSALFFAGITTVISCVEAFVSGVMDKFGTSRVMTTTATCLVGFVGGLVFATDAGLFWIDIVDHFLSHFCLLMSGLLEAILLGWVFGAHRVADYLNESPGMKVGAFWKILMRLFIPVVLFVLVAGEVWENIHKPYGEYSWYAVGAIGGGWIFLTLVAAATLAQRKWKQPL